MYLSFEGCSVHCQYFHPVFRQVVLVVDGLVLVQRVEIGVLGDDCGVRGVPSNLPQASQMLLGPFIGTSACFSCVGGEQSISEAVYTNDSVCDVPLLACTKHSFEFMWNLVVLRYR